MARGATFRFGFGSEGANFPVAENPVSILTMTDSHETYSMSVNNGVESSLSLASEAIPIDD